MIKQLFILTLLFVTVIACNKNQELAETRFHPNGWGGHMNDQVSSIRVKAIWQDCYNGINDFNDLQNL